MTGPAVPRASSLDPLIEEIDVGTTLVKIGDRRRGPLDFNPTAGPGRFRPVRNAKSEVIPTAYLASDNETALAETLLRGASALEEREAPRRLYRIETQGLDMAAIRTTRTLRVARLHGAGLARLGLLRADVIDCPEDRYPYTAQWAHALRGSRTRPHGIAWTSKQNDSGRAYMLWRDRVREDALELIGQPLSLDRGSGLELVREACVAAGVDFDG